MNKTRIRSITIAALAVVFALVLSFAIGSLSLFRSAKAVEYRPSELFSEGTDSDVGASSAEEGGESYVEFTFDKDGGAVYYRHDLALKWFAPASEDEAEGTEETEETGRANPAEACYFALTLAFPEINFTKFTLSFQSAEENISKKSTSTNDLVFLYEDGALKVAVKDASEQPESGEKDEDWTPEAEALHTVDASGDIVIAFSEEDCGAGEFTVTVGGEAVGKFTNVGGYFNEYLSSASSTPRTPLTFKADKLAEGEDVEQKVLVKALNGQSFVLTDGRIEDNADPVLVVNEEIYAYTLGRRWSLTYEAIDVCDSSVTVTRRYAMLGVAGEDGKYPKPLNDDYGALTTSTVFMPTSDALDTKEIQYVSIYFELDDGRTLTSREKEAARVYLSWYAVDDAIERLPSASVYECPACGDRMTVKDYEGLASGWECPNPNAEPEHGTVTKDQLVLTEVDDFDYIIVNRETSGPYYIGLKADDAEKGNKADPELPAQDAENRAAEYQAAVDEAAKDLSAGDGAYFYLPSLRELIASDSADYRNLRFSIYYKKQSMEVGATASSATSLRYNALRFEIDEEGKYVFRVLASDAAGNAMKYYLDGELVTVSSSNIWDIEGIPEFHFSATYSGATVEDLGEQSLGYVHTSYSVSSFDIVGLSGYETSYELYRLDRDLLPVGETISYPSFAEDVREQFATYRDAFVQIKEYNANVTEEETDRWNRTDNDYNWNPDSSLSFVPQTATIYVVKLTVTEARMPGTSVTAYQAIEVTNELDDRPDPLSWLENNVTSVVLFSISAVLLIVIIVLFVVKPSEKNVEEVDLETLRGKRKNKKE